MYKDKLLLIMVGDYPLTVSKIILDYVRQPDIQIIFD